jgi:hypothetical protein
MREQAVEKRPCAVRQAHGPELRRRAALRSSFVTAAYEKVRLSQIPLQRGFLMLSRALHLTIFEQPLKKYFFKHLVSI